MNVSLQQAIEIHARSLKRRFGAKLGTQRAYQEAMRCRANGDQEGFAVWLEVRDAIRPRRADAPAPREQSPSLH
jgi:hypothetical protein